MFANHPEMAKRWAAHTKSIKSLPDSVAKEEKKAFAVDVLAEVLKKAAAPIGFGAVAQPSLKPKTPTLSSVPNAPALPQQNSNQTQYGANGQEAVKQKAKQLQPAQNTKMSFLKKLAEEPPKDSGAMPSRASLISRTPSAPKTSAPAPSPPPPNAQPAASAPTPVYNDPVFRAANPQLARQMELKARTSPPAEPVTLATLSQPKPAVPTMQAAPEVQKTPSPPKPPTGAGFGGLLSAMYPDGFSFNPGVPQATKNQNIHPAIRSETKPEAYANWGKTLTESGGFDIPSAVSTRLDLTRYAPRTGDKEETIRDKAEGRSFESNLLKNIYNMRQLFAKDDVDFLNDPRQPISSEKLFGLADKEQRIFSDYFKQKYPNQEPPNLFSLINDKKTPEQQKVLSGYMSESMQPRMARLSDNRQAEIGLMGDESDQRTAQGISELALNRLSGVDYETLQGGSPVGIATGLASSPLLLGMPLGSAVKALGELAPAAVEGSSILKGLEGASVLKPSTWLGALGNTAGRAARATGRAAMDTPRFVAQHGTNIVKGINEAEAVGNAAQGAATIYDPTNKDFQDTAKTIGTTAGYGYPTASFVAKGLLNAGKNIGNIPKLLGNFANYAKNNKMDLAEEALYAGLSARDFHELPPLEQIRNQQLGTPQQRTVFNYNNAEKFLDEAAKKEPGSQRAAIVKTLLNKDTDLQDLPRTFSSLTNKDLPGLVATTQKLQPSDFKSQISPDLPGYTGASLDFKIDEKAEDQLRDNNIDERVDNLNNMPRSDLGVPISEFQQKEEAEVNSVLQNTFGSNIGEYSKYKHSVKSVESVRKEYDDVMKELRESNALENTAAIHITDPNLVAKAREVTTRYQDAMQKAAPVMVPFLTKSLDKRFEREIKPIQENAPQVLAQVNSIKEKIKQNQPLTEEDMANLNTARDTAYTVKAYTVERMKLQFLRGQDLNAPEMHHLFSPGYESQEKAMDLIPGAAAEDTSQYRKVIDPATGRTSYVSGFAKSSYSPASPTVVGANQPAPAQPAAQPMGAPPPTPPVVAPPAAATPPPPPPATSVKPPVSPTSAPVAPPQTVQNKPSKFQSLLSSAKEKLPEYKEKATVAFQQANDVFEKLRDKTNVPNPNANPVAQEAGRQLENRIKEEASPEVQQNPGVMQNMKSVFWDNLNTTEKTMLISGLSLAAIAAVSSFSGDDEEGGSNILPLLGLIGATAGLAAPASKYFGFSNPLAAMTGGGPAAAAPSETTAGPLPPTKENVIKLVNEGKKPEAAKMFVGMLPFGGKTILRRALSNPGATPESLSSASYGKLDIPTATMVLDNKDYILPLLN